MRIFYLLFFLTLPLYMLEDFRLYVGGLSLTLHQMTTAALVLFGFALRPRKFVRYDNGFLRVMLVAGLFLIPHLIGLQQANGELSAVLFTLKLTLGLAMCVGAYFVVRNLPHIRQNFNKYAQYAIWCSALILGYYLLQNLVIHGNSFFTLNYESGSGEGKNQVQVYLALMVPWAVHYAWHRSGWLNIIAAFIHLVCAVYLSSRGLWVVLIGTAAVGLILYGRYPFSVMRVSMNRIAKIGALGMLLLFGGIIASLLYGDALSSRLSRFSGYVGTRIAKFEEAASGESESGSAHERKYYMQHGMELFHESPIVGSGLANFQKTNIYQKRSHNDYVFFLADMGALGLLCFLAFAATVLLVLVWAGIPHYFFLPFFLDLFFINAYLLPLFWVLLGIALARTELGIATGKRQMPGIGRPTLLTPPKPLQLQNEPHVS